MHIKMKLGKSISELIIVLFIVGCGAPKVVTSYKDNAEAAATQGNYVRAVEAWKQYFNQHAVEEIDGTVYAKAAQDAFLSGDSGLAKKWFDQARYKNFSSQEMYATLANIYHSENNLSKELSALEYCVENYANIPGEIYSRLFDIYVEIKMNEKALSVWPKMPQTSQETAKQLEKYFQLNKEKENTLVCDSVSLLLLKKDSQNIDALEWNAQKYYDKAEKHYEEQMKIYNENKTTQQYRILLKQLDLVTADFKKALPYFEKLWEINPDKKYAGYLANIYTRFGNNEKADYYKAFLETK